jgi:hypothetical protein
MKRIVAITFALSLALVACGKGLPVVSASSPAPTGRPSSTAVLMIVSPTPGQVVSTNGVLVKVSLTGARIIPAGKRALRPDEGHVHLRVDGMTITLFGGLQVSTGKLTEGPHLIEVEFAASDHGPFNPRVIQRVTVCASASPQSTACPTPK